MMEIPVIDRWVNQVLPCVVTLLVRVVALVYFHEQCQTNQVYDKSIFFSLFISCLDQVSVQNLKHFGLKVMYIHTCMLKLIEF